jgi:hypothetical protein
VLCFVFLHSVSRTGDTESRQTKHRPGETE